MTVLSYKITLMNEIFNFEEVEETQKSDSSQSNNEYEK